MRVAFDVPNLSSQIPRIEVGGTIAVSFRGGRKREKEWGDQNEASQVAFTKAAASNESHYENG